MLDKYKKYILIIGLAVGFLGIVSLNISQARQEGEFLVNWRSHGFAPAYYRGKVLITDKTKVDIGFEFVRNKKLVDLRGKSIAWFVNNNLFKRGVGLQQVVIDSPGQKDDLLIRIEVEGLEHSFFLPVYSPDLVIERSGDLFFAWPFFLNVNNLSEVYFQWSVNGQSAAGMAGAPYILNSDISADIANINLQVFAQNKRDKKDMVGKKNNFQP